jgi:hypothetical protein
MPAKTGPVSRAAQSSTLIRQFVLTIFEDSLLLRHVE